MASVDIIEEVRRNIGSGPVPKIDPNTQSPEDTKASSALTNAAIPAVLVGFYKHTRNETQAVMVMQEKDPSNVLNVLFADKKDGIIKSVSECAGVNEATATTEMENVVSITQNVLETQIKNGDAKAVSSFFTDQRSNILKHLPVELNMGELMNDSSVDDRTNKMEGPMSGMMHTIEKIFSSTK